MNTLASSRYAIRRPARLDFEEGERRRAHARVEVGLHGRRGSALRQKHVCIVPIEAIGVRLIRATIWTHDKLFAVERVVAPPVLVI